MRTWRIVLGVLYRSPRRFATTAAGWEAASHCTAPVVCRFGQRLRTTLAADEKLYREQLRRLRNRDVEHAGPGSRILRPNVVTFRQRLAPRHAEPCCKEKLRHFSLQ